jgi:hypothetical protein
MLTSLPSALAHQTAEAACPQPFVLYDNTHYSHLDLEQYGLVRSTVLYEVMAEKQAIAAGQTPDETAFKSRVVQVAHASGPLVLDYEDLYLTGTPATAAFHLHVLTQLATWAHQAAPGKVIGYYGLLGHTATAYLSLARQLAPLQDAFFPSLYTFDDDRDQWLRALRSDLRQAREIDPRMPVYPYIWPQYHEHTPKALQYLDADSWRFELRAIRTRANGAVVWSGTGPNEHQGWVSVTAQFLRTSSTC